MSYKHSIELKIYRDKEGTNKANEISSQILKGIETGIFKTTRMGLRVSKKTVTKQLESTGQIVREGISGGCYGARDGKTYDGLTVYVDASQFPERFIDSDGDEIVNPYALIESNGGVLVEDLNAEEFEYACEDMGLAVRRDNSYNYAERDSESPIFLVDFDFAVICSDNGKAAFLSIKFHCGGDIRGNYTDKVLFKFDSADEIYSVLYPVKELTNSEGK